MKNKIIFKLLIFSVTIVLGYFLYQQILILKSEYAQREEKKNLFLEKIGKTYTNRSDKFYKNN